MNTVLTSVESRRFPRFSINAPVSGQFGSSPVMIRNLGGNGFLILHSDRIPLATQRLLRFVFPPSFDRASHRLRIPQRQPDLYSAEFECASVWSRLDRDPAAPGPVYRTGLRVLDGNLRSELLPILLREFVRPEEAHLDGKRKIARDRAQRAQDLADALMLARTAGEFLRTHPSEAYEWHRRARYALSCRNVPHADNPAIGLTPEMVAVWEFLGRSIPLLTVAHALDGVWVDG